MNNCPACSSQNTERAKNDSGFFRSPSTKPIRLYQWRCIDCGYIGTYTADAPKDKPEKGLLGAHELTPIGGDAE